MKLTWDCVKPHFEKDLVWVDAFEMHWYQYIWSILDEANLTICNSLAEKIAVYGRMFAIVRIYKEFCGYAFDEHSDFEIFFDEVAEDENSEEIRDKISELIEDFDFVYTIFEVLSERLGRNATYYSLWLTRPDVLGREIETYKEYVGALEDENYVDFMNGLSTPKLTSYEWISEYMRGE